MQFILWELLSSHLLLKIATQSKLSESLDMLKDMQGLIPTYSTS